MEKVHFVEPRQYPTSFWIGGGGSNPFTDHTGGILLFQHDLLLEEVTEPFRFGFNPFSDRGCG
jgi:hypothetical protein